MTQKSIVHQAPIQKDAIVPNAIRHLEPMGEGLLRILKSRAMTKRYGVKSGLERPHFKNLALAHQKAVEADKKAREAGKPGFICASEALGLKAALEGDLELCVAAVLYNAVKQEWLQLADVEKEFGAQVGKFIRVVSLFEPSKPDAPSAGLELTYEEARALVTRAVCEVYLSKGKPRPGIDLIVKAHEFAQECHVEQFMLNGSPYIEHPEFVAYWFALWGGSPEAIAVGFLHDVIEDCRVSFKELVKRFGEEVAVNVALMSVPKLATSGEWVYANEDNYVKMRQRPVRPLERDRAFFRHIFDSGSFTPIFGKAFDNAHHLKTLQGLPKERRYRKIGTVKRELLWLLPKLDTKLQHEFAALLAPYGVKVRKVKMDLLPRRNPIVWYPPLDEWTEEELRKLRSPLKLAVNVYVSPESLLAKNELVFGLPRHLGVDWMPLLAKHFPEREIKPRESLAPTESAVSENLFAVKGGFKPKKASKRVFMKEGREYIFKDLEGAERRVPFDQLDKMKLDDEMKRYRREVIWKYKSFGKKLKEFYFTEVKPRLEEKAKGDISDLPLFKKSE